jgi:hypothetical protein
MGIQQAVGFFFFFLIIILFHFLRTYFEFLILFYFFKTKKHRCNFKNFMRQNKHFIERDSNSNNFLPKLLSILQQLLKDKSKSHILNFLGYVCQGARVGTVAGPVL